jgi:hypothetical protein
VRALIAITPPLMLVVLGFALFVLYKNNERQQAHTNEIHYSANYTCRGGPAEKQKGEANDNSRGPNDKYECFNVDLALKSPVDSGPRDSFGIAGFVLITGGFLSALGILAALYIAGDRRAAERGILQAGITNTGRTTTIRLTNVGKTAVLLRCWAGRAQCVHPVGTGDGAIWEPRETISRLIAPAEDGYVDLPVKLKCFQRGQRFAVYFEYQDVFGDVWRGGCWFTKRSARGDYTCDSETENRKW